MRTFIYDIQNQKRIGDIREGWCYSNGEPCRIPEGYTELEMVTRQYPIYDESTQRVEVNEYADVPNKQWVTDWYIVDLTPEEIKERKPKWNYCTPRQFRLALLTKTTNPNYVDDLINTLEDESMKLRLKIEWEYAIQIEKNNQFIQQLGLNLGMDDEELNDFFGFANTL